MDWAKIDGKEDIVNDTEIINDSYFYNSGIIKIYNGDCLKYLDYIEDHSIQLICIDPPYNIGKDTWDNIPNYNTFMMKVRKKIKS